VNTGYASGKKAKNLVATEIKTVAGEIGKLVEDVNGKIIEFLWHLKKNGYNPATNFRIQD
jgi:hypothetical protein